MVLTCLDLGLVSEFESGISKIDKIIQRSTAGSGHAHAKRRASKGCFTKLLKYENLIK